MHTSVEQPDTIPLLLNRVLLYTYNDRGLRVVESLLVLICHVDCIYKIY